eukprot:2659118-Amphidinium_carterae.2
MVSSTPKIWQAVATRSAPLIIYHMPVAQAKQPVTDALESLTKLGHHALHGEYTHKSRRGYKYTIIQPVASPQPAMMACL